MVSRILDYPNIQSVTTREDCLSCPMSGAKYGRAVEVTPSCVRPILAGTRVRWLTGTYVSFILGQFLVILKIGREKRRHPFLPAIDYNSAQEPVNKTAGGERKRQCDPWSSSSNLLVSHKMGTEGVPESLGRSLE